MDFPSSSSSKGSKKANHLAACQTVKTLQDALNSTVAKVTPRSRFQFKRPPKPDSHVDMVSAHVRAPISLHRPDQRDFIHWFISPELMGSLKSGYLYHLGPYPMDPTTEEWCFACARLPHEQHQKFDEADMLRRMHATLQIPDLDVELLSLTHWHVNAIVAEQYRTTGGRIFLVGDTAHRVPPWGKSRSENNAPPS